VVAPPVKSLSFVREGSRKAPCSPGGEKKASSDRRESELSKKKCHQKGRGWSAPKKKEGKAKFADEKMHTKVRAHEKKRKGRTDPACLFEGKEKKWRFRRPGGGKEKENPSNSLRGRGYQYLHEEGGGWNALFSLLTGKKITRLKGRINTLLPWGRKRKKKKGKGGTIFHGQRRPSLGRMG